MMCSHTHGACSLHKKPYHRPLAQHPAFVLEPINPGSSDYVTVVTQDNKHKIYQPGISHGDYITRLIVTTWGNEELVHIIQWGGSLFPW